MKGWIATIAAVSLLLAGCGGTTTATEKTVTETQVQSQVTTVTPTPPAEPQSSDGSDCQSAPILGVDPPQARTICDTAIGPDGSWMRIRQIWLLHDGQDVQDPSDVIDSKTYTVTVDTIPPGEPGHLG